MKFSKKSSDVSVPTRPEPHFAAEGGVAYEPLNNRDPYEILDELMVVIEALCPRWPERELRRTEVGFRL